MGIWDIGNGDGISGTPYFSNVAQMCPVVQAGTPEPRNPGTQNRDHGKWTCQPFFDGQKHHGKLCENTDDQLINIDKLW